MGDDVMGREIGEYMCEDLYVSDYDWVHIDSNGDMITVFGYNK